MDIPSGPKSSALSGLNLRGITVSGPDLFVERSDDKLAAQDWRFLAVFPLALAVEMCKIGGVKRG
jgi:hypothetical protein